MRIFLFHYYNAIANPAYTQISQAMRDLGHEVMVAYRNENDDLMLDQGTEPKLGIRAPKRSHGPLAVILNKLYFLLFVLKVRHLIKTWAPDVVQINRANVSWYWILPLFPGKTRFILDCRQVDVRKTLKNPIRALRQKLRARFHLFSIKHLFHKASYLHERGATKELGEKWRNHGMVVPLGVGNPFLEADLGSPKITANDHCIRFIYIGSITRIRKLEVLIEAAKMQQQENKKPFELIFAGPDNTGGHYKNLVDKWQLANCVKFLGPTPYNQIPQLLNQHHVALAYVPNEPQDWVYQPTLKILEYQALGIPVLASDVPPNRDIIDANHNGIVVGQSSQDWQQGMNKYIENPSLYESTRINAIKNRQGESWRDVASLYIHEYEKLV